MKLGCPPEMIYIKYNPSPPTEHHLFGFRNFYFHFPIVAALPFVCLADHIHPLIQHFLPHFTLCFLPNLQPKQYHYSFLSSSSSVERQDLPYISFNPFYSKLSKPVVTDANHLHWILLMLIGLDDLVLTYLMH